MRGFDDDEFRSRTFAIKFARTLTFLTIMAYPSMFARHVNAAPVPLELLAGWDFQTTSNGGTSVLALPNTPKVYQANFGTGTLYANGLNGSSDWLVTGSQNTTELSAFAGSGVNATNGLTSVTTTPAALAFVAGGIGLTANGKSAVFTFATLGKSAVSVSYSSQRSDQGFTSQSWSYSTDGSNFLSLTTLSSGVSAGTITSDFNTSGVLTLPTLPSAVENLPTVWLKVTFTGATSFNGNNRIDNVQVMAVPEPLPLVLGTLAAATTAFAIRSRNMYRV